MNLGSRHLLGIERLEPAEITAILDAAESFAEISTREIKKVPTLRGKTVVNFFVEPSTRTRSSFELAEKRLSADSLNFSTSTSSLVKGETLLDTAKNLEAMAPEFIVMRHSEPGAPHFLARHCRASIINAGDGSHEHPTQALLDALTIRQRKGRLEGLQGGDRRRHPAQPRGALERSPAHPDGRRRRGLCGPPTLMPRGDREPGVRRDLQDRRGGRGSGRGDDAPHPARADAGGILSDAARVRAATTGSTRRDSSGPREDAIVMHPGPINRGVEITGEVADGNASVILDQVTNGVAVRMAVLYLLAGGTEREAAA